jgi:hypothetical protein
MNNTHQIIKLDLSSLLTESTAYTEQLTPSYLLSGLLYNDNFKGGGYYPGRKRRSPPPKRHPPTDMTPLPPKLPPKLYLSEEELKVYAKLTNIVLLLPQFTNAITTILIKLEEHNPTIGKLIGGLSLIKNPDILDNNQRVIYNKLSALEKLYKMFNESIILIDTRTNDKIKEIKEFINKGLFEKAT